MTNEDRKIIEEYVDRMTLAFSKAIFVEIQELKNDIREVKESIGKTNNSLEEVGKWATAHQACHDALDKDKELSLKTIGVF